MQKSDFISATELSQLTGYTVNAIYAQHQRETGVLAPILTKLGAKVGCWREDYEVWKASLRRLPAPDVRSAAA